MMVIMCCACSASQEKFISAGSGGGFAGTVAAYKISRNGDVFKGSGVGEIIYTQCGKIRKSEAKKLIKKVAHKTLSSKPFTHPGNLYYFLSYTDDGTEQTITWGDANHALPDDIKKIYDEVNASISAVRCEPIK